MLRIHEAIRFLDQQGAFCAEHSKNAPTKDLVLKYGILADIYYTLAATIQIATTPQSVETMSDTIGKALDRVDEPQYEGKGSPLENWNPGDRP